MANELEVTLLWFLSMFLFRVVSVLCKSEKLYSFIVMAR